MDDGVFQFGNIKRFLEKIIRFCILGELADIAVGAEENDGYSLNIWFVLKLSGRLDPARARYPVIHENDIGLIAPDIFKDIGGIIERGYVKPLFFENDRADLKDIQIVIKYQYPFVHVTQL